MVCLSRFFVACFGGADPTASTKPLVPPPPSRILRRKKSNWRPALESIYEDNAPSHRERTTAVSAGDVTRRQTTAAAATAKIRRRLYRDDCDYGSCRRAAMSVTVPAFSPTPFMF